MAEAKGITIFWRGLTLDSRILLAADMESVIIIILSFSMAGMRPMWIAISSASIEVTLMAWICTCLTMELSDQI